MLFGLKRPSAVLSERSCAVLFGTAEHCVVGTVVCCFVCGTEDYVVGLVVCCFV